MFQVSFGEFQEFLRFKNQLAPPSQPPSSNPFNPNVNGLAFQGFENALQKEPTPLSQPPSHFDQTGFPWGE